MKKTSEKRLALQKITVTNLSSKDLGNVKGARAFYTNHSICADQCCASDPNLNCDRTF